MNSIKKFFVVTAVAGATAVVASTGTANASTGYASTGYASTGYAGTVLTANATAGWQADQHRDGHGDLDGHGDRDRDAHRGWRHYDRFGWYPGAVTTRQCFEGHGHPDWNRDQCVGGRFDDFLIRG